MRGLLGSHRPAEDVLAVVFGQVREGAKVKDCGKIADDSILKGLNVSQREAMAKASSRCFTLVQGPPGTGKTTVAVQILKAWALSKESYRGGGVLSASDSNIAVDNVVEGLALAGVSVVRVGRPESARAEVLKHCVDEIACKHLNMASRKEANQDSAARERMKQAVQEAIVQASVVCCTAIGAGSIVLNEHHFSRMLFDEAAQATELATLVPICRGASQVVLCGDQCQLPPTVGVDSVRGQGLELSLFERLAAVSYKPHVLLEAQHRMNPAISAFPRAVFYAGRLLDGIGAEDRPPPKGFSWPNVDMPLCFLPTCGSERREGDSLCNDSEADRVIAVVQDFLRGGLEPAQVGIVTPYAAQVRLLRNRLARVGLPTSCERGGVETNSVDGYQGREKDAIVISTVRSSSAGGLGFVADWRRANVALTRAKRGLVVIGDPATLGREPVTWALWLKWVRRTGCYSPVGSLDSLPLPRREVEPVGLSAKFRTNPEELLQVSSATWAKGGGAAEQQRHLERSCSCSRSRARKRRSRSTESSQHLSNKRKLAISKDEKKERANKTKKEDKAKKKERKHKHRKKVHAKAKKCDSSSVSSSS